MLNCMNVHANMRARGGIKSYFLIPKCISKHGRFYLHEFLYINLSAEHSFHRSIHASIHASISSLCGIYYARASACMHVYKNTCMHAREIDSCFDTCMHI